MLRLLTKTLLILHLSFAFSAFLWILSDPFMGEHFRKAQNHLYIKNLKAETTLWETLATEEKDKILHIEEKIETLPTAPVYLRYSLFLYIWIALSIPLPILYLKGRENLAPGFAFLPLLVILYAFDLKDSSLPDLIPTERELVSTPLTGSLKNQQETLQKAFDDYLIKNWGEENPSQESSQRQVQLVKAKFNFNKAEILRREARGFDNLPSKEPALFLWAYLLWNSAVTCIVLVDRWKSRQDIPPALRKKPA